MKIIMLNDGIEKLDELLDMYNLEEMIEDYSESKLRKLLSPINITFACDGISRVHSMLLCELCDSYCQQSQRYVKMSGSAEEMLCLPQFINPELKETIIKLTNKSIDLYNRMTELKDEESSSKRKTIDSFKYGIPYEDGRYVLPLAVKTNIVVTMSGDKLIDLFKMMLDPENEILFYDFIEHLKEFFPSDIYFALYDIGERGNTINSFAEQISFNNCMKYFTQLTKEDNAQQISIDPMTNVIYATLASQNEESPIDVFERWSQEDLNNDDPTKYQRGIDMINRVVGYGHTSILEHHRSTFAMTCSLSAYHQVIRHRLQKIFREPISNLVDAEKFDYYVPQTILASKFYDEYKALMEEYRNLFAELTTVNNPDGDMDMIISLIEHSVFALPNATMIRFIVSSNARNDNIIFRDRLCLTAQTEIREMYKKKFDILYNLYPHFYKYGIPPCVTDGKCKEGKMCCGKASEMKELYKV